MALADLVSVVNDVVLAQAAPAAAAPRAAARFLGATLTSAERGNGITSLDAYVRNLRAVQVDINRSAVAGRVRYGLFPERRTFGGLFDYAGAIGWPNWYGGTSPSDVDRSRSFDALVRHGYLALTRVGQTELVGVRRLWLPADWRHFNDGAWMSLKAAALRPETPGLVNPFDLLTWSGGLARAWLEWQSWRVRFHDGLPLDEWAANEPMPFDAVPLRRAMARAFPLEDLHGALDGYLIATRSKEAAALTDTWADLVASYYAALPGPDGPNVADRTDLFLRTSPVFRELQAGGHLLEADLQEATRPVVAEAVGRLLVTLGATDELERYLQSPWGKTSTEMLADQFAAFLAGTAGPLGAWPGAGYGARTVGPAGTVEPLYGGFDLQIGDDDAGNRYGGVAQPADAGDRVAELVTDLRALGFTAPAAAVTAFDARVAMAVREFQVEASQATISAEEAGVRGTHEQYRRYLGEIHGVVDAETRRVLQLWLGLARIDGEQPELQAVASLANPRNGLDIVACASTNTPAPVASQAIAGNIWGPEGTPAAGGVDNFDFSTEDRRHWAVDHLCRYGTPVAAEAPVLADFGGAAVPLQGVDVVPLGRFNAAGPLAFDIGGPITFQSDHWASTELTLARFQANARADLPARQADWRVVYAMTAPETWGYADVVNAWDPALLSFGWCHWTLMAAGDDGELGALLAWYRARDAGGFQDNFGAWGVRAVDWSAVTRPSPGKYTAPVPLFGVHAPTGAVKTADASAPAAADAYLKHTWLRSWRSIYRVQQALRLSPGLANATREFAVQRIWSTLNTEWRGTARFTAGTTLSDLVNSEQALVALMRWHVNRPGQLFTSAAGNVAAFFDGAVTAASAAYLAAVGAAAPIPAANLRIAGQAGAVAFQNTLIAELGNPAADGTGTVRVAAALAATPGGVALSPTPGSYLGPLPVPTP